MKFNKADDVDSICYSIKLADWPRALNRRRINDLMNGLPPFTQDEVEKRGIKVNVNDLGGTRSTHNARMQFYTGFLKPGRFFSCRTDAGPKNKRTMINDTVSREIAKPMKRSIPYFESIRSKIAQLVLHGIAPNVWDDRDHWCPEPAGIEDVGIAAQTLLTMKNLPFFYIYHTWTAPELIRMTSGPRVDPAWNMPLVERCLSWIDRETMALGANNWPDAWSPERLGERIKGDGGCYAWDEVPTIDVFDFYFWSDTGKSQGWRRRVLLDSWGTPASAGVGSYTMARRGGDLFGTTQDFLYNPGNRVYANKLSEIITWQFADLSAVAPFRYHSVRSLGYLLYAVCHLQNRMHSAFTEAVFEALMQYFRVNNEDDYQRALKIVQQNRAFIDKSIEMIPASERWQINAALVELGMKENREIINDSSSSFAQQTNYSNDRTEKTKFQVMAEVQGTMALVSAAFLQAYRYQEQEDREIFRRFLKKNSKDPDVRQFRESCLKQGVPEEVLNDTNCWEIEHEKVLGAGNKTLEMAISEQLLQMRTLYDPDAQRRILHDVTLAITDDPARADTLVPEGNRPISQSVHDAQMALGAILQGKTVAPTESENHIEVVSVWMRDLAMTVQGVVQSGGMANPQQLQGMANLSAHIKSQIELIAADPEQKQLVKQMSDALGKLDNEIKAFAQRLQQAMQKQQQAAQQNGQNGMDPKDMAKIQATIIGAKTKAQLQAQSHAQRMAQRQIQFEQKMRQDQQKQAVDVAAKDLETAGTIRRNRMNSFNE